MTLTVHDALVLLAILAAAASLLALAPKLHVPYPILLVLGGLGLAFVPELPTVALSPELVLVGVLPPLLYASAYFTSLREFSENRRPISLLAVGLVLVTMLAVAGGAHAFVGLDWAPAFVLGAIVSPTDPTAATAIARRLGVPRRVVVVIEGESLVNDGTALVAYRYAVVAVAAGSFSLAHATASFFGSVAGGIAMGLAVGWLVRQARRRIDDPPAEIAIALLTGYFAYLPAEAAGVSGVLAAVTAGLYVGWFTPELTNSAVRLQGDAVWNIVVFCLNTLLFTLLGLQLRSVLDGVSQWSPARLAWYGLAVGGTVILTRLVWIFPATYLPRLLLRRVRERDPSPPWQGPAAIGWAGMRGAVSLAAALAIPLTTDAGEPFPGRDLIVFLTFSVILVTLVFQGLTLPLVIRLLGLEDDGIDDRLEAKARIKAADAALARLAELVAEGWVREDTAERMRGAYTFRKDRFASRFDDGDDGAIEERSQSYQRLRRELLEAERGKVVELRRRGFINDDVMNRVQRDLDLEVERLDVR
ncbi:MAG TPA: Na+/H+ antiporter [Gaiellaceae bacterium]|nr:Na+/H+ antiporter [Gaiellaceae bacterium]